MHVVYEPRCRYRAKIKLEWAKTRFVAGICGLDVVDLHDGVAEGLLSGERLCRMKSGRRDLAGV